MKLNQVYIEGNLVKDAQTKIMSNGKQRITFTVAINDDYKKTNSDEWVKRAYFIDCYCNKEYANMAKGSKVVVTGKLVSRQYEVNGQKKKYVGIEVLGLEHIQRSQTQTALEAPEDVRVTYDEEPQNEPQNDLNLKVESSKEYDEEIPF